MADEALRHPEFRAHVARGDARRDAREWTAAFNAYRAALDLLPLHGSYLVQAGHCLKELELFCAAEGYYRSALLFDVPFEEVGEHLVFVSERNRYYEPLQGLQSLHEAVMAGTLQARARPSFDDMVVLSNLFHPGSVPEIGQLLNWMRGGHSYAGVVSHMVETWGPPATLLPVQPGGADPLKIGGLPKLAAYRALSGDALYEEAADWAILRGAAVRDRLDAGRFTVEQALRHSEFREHARRGDARRDAGEWAAAFAAYRAALDLLPLHGGYLVQAGHCLKEVGLFGTAEGYYRSAVLLGGPLEEVGEHLVFVSERNRHHETFAGLRSIHEAALVRALQVRARPSFDDMLILSGLFAPGAAPEIGRLLSWMREGRSYAGVAAVMLDAWGPPSALPLPSTLREAFDAWNAGVGRPGANSRINGTGSPVGAVTQAVHDDGTRRAGAAAAETPPRGSGRSPWLRRLLGWGLSPELDSGPANAELMPASGTESKPSDTAVDVARLAQDIGVAGQEKSTALFFGSIPRRVDPRNVSLDDSGKPEVSILILNRDRAALTLLCVVAAMSAGTSVPYEIIVVDNASGPTERELLNASDFAIRRLDLPVHRSFAEANNRGAEIARGRHLLFLNNDAFLAPGAVDALLDALRAQPDARISGPLILSIDGQVLDAGGFLDPDGVVSRRGRFDSSFDPEMLPAADIVDVVSGACLLTTAAAFRDVAGFSGRYEPAYYEDVDLCLKMRRADGITVLARGARCYHIENATARAHGMPDPDAINAYHNRALLARWGHYLGSRAPGAAEAAIASPLAAPGPSSAAQGAAAVRRAVFWAGDFGAGDRERFTLAALAATPDPASHAVVAPSGWSWARLREVAADFGLQPPPVSLDAAALTSAELELALESADGLWPPGNGRARQRIFLARSPCVPENLSRRTLAAGWERLRACTQVIVPSAFAERTFRGLLAEFGGPSVPIVIQKVGFAPPVARKQRGGPMLVLAIGRFNDPAIHVETRLLFEACSATQRLRNNARLVLAGAFGSGSAAEGAAQACSRIEDAATQSGIRLNLLVRPDAIAIDRLFSRAAIYVEVRGIGAKPEHGEDWRCDLFGYRAARAAAAGCKVLAWHRGAAADEVGVRDGATFSGPEDLAGLLEAALG